MAQSVCLGHELGKYVKASMLIIYLPKLYQSLRHQTLPTVVIDAIEVEYTDEAVFVACTQHL